MPSNRYNVTRRVGWLSALGALVLILALAGAAAAASHPTGGSLPGPGGGGPETCTLTNAWSVKDAGTSNQTFKGYSTIQCNVDGVKVTGTNCFQEFIPLGDYGAWHDAYGCAVIPGTSPAVINATKSPYTATLAISKLCQPVNTPALFRMQIDWFAQFPDGTNEIFPATVGNRTYDCEMNLYGNP